MSETYIKAKKVRKVFGRRTVLVNGLKWRFEMTNLGPRARKLHGPMAGRYWRNESFTDFADRMVGQKFLPFAASPQAVSSHAASSGPPGFEPLEA